jgi:hypothetical protein
MHHAGPLALIGMVVSQCGAFRRPRWLEPYPDTVMDDVARLDLFLAAAGSVCPNRSERLIGSLTSTPAAAIN